MNVMKKHLNQLANLTFLLCGCIVGLLLAQIVSEVARLDAGKAELGRYAQRLNKTAAEIDDQTAGVVSAVSKDGMGFCSPQEINFMRGLVYRSSEIKDIGRIRDGRFYCSSEIGVVSGAIKTEGTLALTATSRVYVWIPVMLANQAAGVVVRGLNVNMVINPNAFEVLREPSMSYGVYTTDSLRRGQFQGFGQRLPVEPQDVMNGRPFERHGVYYHPICSKDVNLCVLVSETRAAMLTRGTTMHLMLLTAGAALGSTLVLVLILFDARHRSQEAQLRRALRRNALTVVYQPIIDLTTSRIHAAEALVRWTDERGNVVSPDVFVALAEQKLFVREITRFVLRSAMSELGDLLSDRRLKININIASQDLSDPTFIPFLSETLEGAGVSASALGIELTERSTMNNEEAIATIATLRECGHTVYIDDFGTGYSSLAYLSDLKVDSIKIDRAFTATVGTNSVRESIVPQILQMAKGLGLSIVVEGVETLEQARYFRAAVHDAVAQGWLFSRPVAAGKLRDLVLKQHPHPHNAAAMQAGNEAEAAALAVEESTNCLPA